MWVQLQIPKIEDGNNFGVAVQVSKQSHVESIFRVKFIQLHFKSSFVSTRRKCLSCWPTHAPRSKDSRLRFQSKSLHWRSQENRPDITPSKVFGRENHKTCCAQYHKNIHNYWEIYTYKQQFRLSEGLIHLYLVKSNRKKSHRYKQNQKGFNSTFKSEKILTEIMRGSLLLCLFIKNQTDVLNMALDVTFSETLGAILKQVGGAVTPLFSLFWQVLQREGWRCGQSLQVAPRGQCLPLCILISILMCEWEKCVPVRWKKKLMRTFSPA